MLDQKEEAVAAYLSQADVDMIQIFVDENIIAKNQSMIAKQIYAAIKDKLERADMPESVFMGGLSANVRGNYIVGIIGKKRIGYVSCDKVELKFKPTAEIKIPRSKRSIVSITSEDTSSSVTSPGALPQKELAKAPSRIMADYKHAHHVWIGRRMFKVKRSFKDLEILLCDILEGKKEDGGLITFNGESYSCNSNRIFEAFITSFLGAMQCGESDPVLNDDSGVPVELRIAS